MNSVNTEITEVGLGRAGGLARSERPGLLRMGPHVKTSNFKLQTSGKSQTSNLKTGSEVLRRRWMETRVVDWLPLSLLPLVAIAIRNVLPAWLFMWAMAFAIFFGC